MPRATSSCNLIIGHYITDLGQAHVTNSLDRYDAIFTVAKVLDGTTNMSINKYWIFGRFLLGAVNSFHWEGPD
jgi:hypothetical protein